jgi:membrane protein
MRRFLRLLRHSLVRAFQHDAFAIAKAAAYSGTLTLFPGLIFVGSIMATSNLSEVFLREISHALGVILPPGVGATVASMLDQAKDKPVRFIVTAGLITLWTSSGVMVSWMEGFRNAYQLPQVWGVVKERLIAFAMVLMAGAPLAFATLLVAFGNQFENWVELYAGHQFGPMVVLLWTGLRWLIALLTSIAVLSLIYHFAIPRTQPLHKVLPGAALASVLWFPATMLFGVYLHSSHNDYNLFYGTLATAIALLVWFYIICVIVLIGAECNAYLFPRCGSSSAAVSVATPVPKAQKRVKARG